MLAWETSPTCARASSPERSETPFTQRAALTRCEQPGQETQQGRLAGAVGTEQRQAVARLQSEAHLVDDAAPAERADEPVGEHDGHGLSHL